MGRFVFRLAPVLRHREHLEDDKKLALGAALRAEKEAADARDQLNARREDLARELVGRHANLDGETLRITYAHLEYLAREITRADEHVLVCMQLSAVAREALVAASRDRKVLEQLRERQKRTHEAEESRIEQRDSDDANARRHARIQREGARP